MSILRRRGRPRSSSSPKTLAADTAIARTVYHLVTWGFPLRSRGTDAGVCEVVGLEACRILQRTDSVGRALGPDRVEQIFEAWFDVEQASRRTSRRWPLIERWRYSKGSLTARLPDKGLSLEEVAAELLLHGGCWIRQYPSIPTGDLELNPKAALILGPTPKFAKTG